MRPCHRPCIIVRPSFNNCAARHKAAAGGGLQFAGLCDDGEASMHAMVLWC